MAAAPTPAPAGGLHAFAEKGRRKYAAKLSMMKSNYRAAIGRAISNYKAVIPGPTRQRNYETAMNSYAASNYETAMTTDKADKWYRNWISAMSI